MLRWISAQFLLYPYPGPLGGWSKLAMPIAFAALLVGSFVARGLARRSLDRAGADWWRAAASWLLGLSIPGLLLTFFAWQRVPFLSMRILLVANVLAVIAVAAWMAWRWFRMVPQRRAGVQRRREYTRYLPS